MQSREYLETLLEKVKDQIPDAIWRELHRAAMPKAGGKASWREPEITILEKLALAEMRPSMLTKVEDDEIKAAWLRLNQWYGQAKRRKRPIEDIVNAAVWVKQELDKRGIGYDKDGALSQETEKISKALMEVKPSGNDNGDLISTKDVLPHFKDFMLRKEYITVVGGICNNEKGTKGDIDILVKDCEELPDEWKKVIEFRLMRALPEEMRERVHFLYDDLKGPFTNHIPIYNLLFQRCNPDNEVIKMSAEETEKQEDVGTRGEEAEKAWQAHWQEMYPSSGKGQFVYQHHWRGLTEEEKDDGEEKLLQTDHSLHGDIRLKGPGSELFGFTIALGETSENKGNDKLYDLKGENRLRTFLKLSQPSSWLSVGEDGPMIVEPGGVGATSDKWAKFFKEDGGEYEIGVWNRHLVELFLKGKHLKGRYVFQSAPLAGGNERVWLVSKPEDQKPMAETLDLEQLIAKLKPRDHQWLVWAKPGTRPQLVNVKTGKIVKSLLAPILCTNDEKQIIYSIVAEPDTVDLHGHKLSVDNIERACHKFMDHLKVGLEHKNPAAAKVIENLTIPPDVKQFYGKTVKPGTWIVGIHIQDSDTWRDVKNGKYTGVSLGGYARKVPDGKNV